MAAFNEAMHQLKEKLAHSETTKFQTTLIGECVEKMSGALEDWEVDDLPSRIDSLIAELKVIEALVNNLPQFRNKSGYVLDKESVR